MKTPIRLLLVIFTITLLSCGSSDDGMEEPEIVVDPNPNPDKVSTYTADVKAIIDSNCLACHGDPLAQGAPMMLITFDQVKNAVAERGLFTRIATTNMFNIMPPTTSGGRMAQADIDSIEDWIADGLLEQ